MEFNHVYHLGALYYPRVLPCGIPNLPEKLTVCGRLRTGKVVIISKLYVHQGVNVIERESVSQNPLEFSLLPRVPNRQRTWEFFHEFIPFLLNELVEFLDLELQIGKKTFAISVMPPVVTFAGMIIFAIICSVEFIFDAV